MAAPIGFGEIPGIPYDVICVCACVHLHACTCMRACAHVCGDPVTTPHPHPTIPPPPSTHPPPTPQGGGPPESVKIQ